MLNVKTMILGHRGASAVALENTALAFKKAIAFGADGIELDIHLSADDKLVVMHDEKVDRITDGKGYIKDMSLAKLKKLNIKNTKTKDNNFGKILTLKEALELVKECSLINIELKNSFIYYQNIEEKAIKVVKEFGIENKVIFSSFNHYSVKKIKDLKENYKTGILYMASLYKPWEYAKKLGVDMVHPYYQSVDKEMVYDCHKNDIKVVVFGANNKKDLVKLIEANVDVIITDFPKKALNLRDK